MNFLSSTRNPLSATLFAIGERNGMWKLWKLSFHYSTESGLERRVCVAVVWANSNLIHIETTNDDNPPSTTVELRLFFERKLQYLCWNSARVLESHFSCELAHENVEGKKSENCKIPNTWVFLIPLLSTTFLHHSEHIRHSDENEMRIFHRAKKNILKLN